MNRNIAKRVWAWIMITCMLFTCLPASLAEEVVSVAAEEPVEVAPVAEVEIVEPEAVEPAPEPEAPADEIPAEETPVEEVPVEEVVVEAEPEIPAEPEEEHPVIAEAPEAEVPEAEAPELFADATETITLEEAIMLLAGGETLSWFGGNGTHSDPSQHKAVGEPTVAVPGVCGPTEEDKSPAVMMLVCSCGASTYVSQDQPHTFKKPDRPADEAGNCGKPSVWHTTCSVCGVEGDYTEATGQQHVSTEEMIPATCSQPQKLHTVCSVCGKELSEPTVVMGTKSLGHHWVQDPSVKKDCTKAWDDRWYCDRPQCDGNKASDQQTAVAGADENQKKNPTAEEECKENASGVRAVWMGTVQASGVHQTGQPVHEAATCTKPGANVTYCTVCGQVVKTEPIEAEPALGHKYGPWTPVVPDEDAEPKEEPSAHKMTRTCTDPACSAETEGHTQTVSCSEQKATGGRDEKANSWTWKVDHKDATCNSYASDTYTCSACQWSSGVILDTESGYSKTHEWMTPDFNEDPENPTTYYKVFPSTCTEPGVYQKKCKNCGAREDTYTSMPAGHAWEKVPGASEPTCTDKGTLIYVCRKAGCTGPIKDTDTDDATTKYSTDEATGHAKKTVTSAALGHRRADGTQITIDEIRNNQKYDKYVASTCSVKGYYEWKCAFCDNYDIKKELPLNPNNHADGVTEGQAKEWVAATCTTPITHAVVCKNCHQVVKGTEDEIESAKPLGHVWELLNEDEKPDVTKGAICGETKWKRQYKCTRANCPGGQTTEYDTLAAGTHDYETPLYGSILLDMDYVKTEEEGCAYAESISDVDWNGNGGEHDIDWEDNEHYVEIPGTCTQPACKARICKICGQPDLNSTFDEDYSTVGVHKWTEWEVDNSLAGYNNCHAHVRYCQYEGCTYAKDADEWIPSPGENIVTDNTELPEELQADDIDDEYKTLILVGFTLPNCQQPELLTKKCQFKGCTFHTEEAFGDDIDPDYHIFKDEEHPDGIWHVTKEATCKEAGTKAPECLLCHDTITESKVIEGGGKLSTEKKPVTETIPASHHWVLDTSEESGTASKETLCTTGGKAVYYCDREGCEDNASSLTGTEGDATFEWDGTNNRMKKIVENQPKTGHSYEKLVDGEYVKDETKAVHTKLPSCSGTGTDTYTCTFCGNVENVTVDKIAHTAPENPQTEDYKYVKPDCLHAGYLVLLCEVCGEEIEDTKQEVVNQPATGHDLTRVVIPEGADCKSGYTKLLVCANPNCPGYDADNAGGATKDWTDENGHKFAAKDGDTVGGGQHNEDTSAEAKAKGYPKTLEEPTCEQNAGVWRLCSVCGKEYQDDDQQDDWFKNPPAGREEEKTSFEATGHDWGDWEPDPESYKKTEGATIGTEETHKHLRKCKNDPTHIQHEDDKDVGDKPEAFSPTSEIIPATCGTYQQTKYTCNICKLEYTRTTGNTYDESKHETANTDDDRLVFPADPSEVDCTTPSIWQYKCDNPNCNKVWLDYYQKPASHQWTVQSETAAGCENDGVKIEVCTRDNCPGKTADDVSEDPNVVYGTTTDGKAQRTTTTKATGHSYEKWQEKVGDTPAGYVFDRATAGDPTSTEPATCVADGKDIWECKNCDATHEEPIKSQGTEHTFEEVEVTAQTCEEPAYQHLKVCKYCGTPDPTDTPEEKVIPGTKPSGHIWTLKPGQDETITDCTKPRTLVYICTREGCKGHHEADYTAKDGAIDDKKTHTDIQTVVYGNEDGVATATITYKPGTHVAKTADDEGDATMIIPATCTKNAQLCNICKICGQPFNPVDMYTTPAFSGLPEHESYKATGHNFVWTASDDKDKQGKDHEHTGVCQNENCPGWTRDAGDATANGQVEVNGKMKATYTGKPSGWSDDTANADKPGDVEKLQPYDWRITTVNETCQREAGLKYTCPVCDDYSFDTTTAKEEADEKHPFSEDYEKNRVVINGDNCTNPGIKQYICPLCGAAGSYFAYGGEHVWCDDEDAEVVDPTCKDKGYTLYHCVREGGCTAPNPDGTPATKKDKETDTDSTKHVWYTNADHPGHPGHVDSAFVFEFCEICGKMRSISALNAPEEAPTCFTKGHDGAWSGQHAGITKIPAEAPSYTHQYKGEGWKCTVCGKIIVEPSLIGPDTCEHTELKAAVAAGTTKPAADQQPTVKATCKTPAKYAFTCSVCGNSVDLEYGEPDTVNGHDFENGTDVAAVPATCIAGGKTAGKKCAYCDATQGVTETEPDPVLGHNYVKTVVDGKITEYDEAKGVVTTEADCDTKSVTTYTCTLCTEEDQVENHSVTVEGEVDLTKHDKDATNLESKENEQLQDCEHAHTYDFVIRCSACGQELQRFENRTDPEQSTPLGHDWQPTGNFQESNCTEAGWDEYQCKREGCMYNDTHDGPKTEKRPRPIGQHQWQNSVWAYDHSMMYDVCTVCGEMRNVSYLGEPGSEPEPNDCFKKAADGKWSGKHAGPLEKIDRLDPQPGVPGHTEGLKCAACEQYIIEPTPLEALPECDHAELDAKIEADGYDPTTDEDATLVTPATCVEGATYSITCPGCDTKQTRTIGDPDTETGHDYVESVAEDGTITYDESKGKVTTEADCVTAEVKTYTCETCGESVKNHTKAVTGKVNPENHKNAQQKEQQPATCMAKGHEAGLYCDACKTWITGNDIDIDKENGHNFVGGRTEVTKAAKCETPGETTTYCTICDGKVEGGTQVDTTTPAKLGHSWERHGFTEPADKSVDDPDTGWVVTELKPDSDDSKDPAYKTTSGTGHYECKDCDETSEPKPFTGPTMYALIYRFKTTAKIYEDHDSSSRSWSTKAKQQLRFYSWDTGAADKTGNGATFMRVWDDETDQWGWVNRNDWVFEEFKSKAK